MPNRNNPITRGAASGGSTNLSYTASPTQGLVNSDTGTDATIPLADGTNAGLITPAEKTKLGNTTGTNTGDQDLSVKENTITAGSTAQYFRGDKTFQTLNAAAVGLANVNNTTDALKPVSTATQTALNLKENSITATTNVDFWSGAKTFLNFATTVRAVVLTGLSLVTNSAILATDTVLVAFGKLQAQITGIISPEVWVAPTLLNSWINFGAGFAVAGYYKDGSGIVRLKGLIGSGTTTVGTALFTLPVGYRPSEAMIFVANSGGTIAEVRVETNGNVAIHIGTNTFLSLQTVAFRV